MKRIKEYLNSNSLELHYRNSMLNVVCYDEILLLTDEKIIISKDKKQIVIKGENLTLLKLLDNEVLIQGVIKVMEL